MENIPQKWGEWLFQRSRYLGFTTNTALCKAVDVSLRQLKRWYKLSEPPRLQESSMSGLSSALKVTPTILTSTWSQTAIDFQMPQSPFEQSLSNYTPKYDTAPFEHQSIAMKMKNILIALIEQSNEQEIFEIYDLIANYQDESNRFKLHNSSEPDLRREKPIKLLKRIHARKMPPIHFTTLEDVDRLNKKLKEIEERAKHKKNDD